MEGGLPALPACARASIRLSARLPLAGASGRFGFASLRVPLSRETHEPIHGAWRRHPCRRHSRERGTRKQAPAGADPQGSAPRKPTACFLLPGLCGARDGGTKPMEGPCVSRKKEASSGRIEAAPREEGAQTKGESKRPSREPRRIEAFLAPRKRSTRDSRGFLG